MNLLYFFRPGKHSWLRGIWLTGLLVTGLFGPGGCAQVREVPATWEPESYNQVSVEQLLHPKASGLASGQRVKVPAYFWEFLTYDPAMVRNYLTMAAHPLAWGRLKWFAVYERPQMTGYFDLMALGPEERRSFPYNRLDHLMVYGELASMGGGLLYVRVHRVKKLGEDENKNGAARGYREPATGGGAPGAAAAEGRTP